jgi:hypothetical protein
MQHIHIERAEKVTQSSARKDTNSSSVGIVTGYGLDRWGSIPGTDKDVFLYSTAARMALGSTQSPIQRVPGAVLSRGKAAVIVKLITHLYLVLRPKMVELHLYSSIRLNCRPQWPRSVRHEPCSPARTLGSCVRIPFEIWMSVCV